jgi:hypothetical protein
MEYVWLRPVHSRLAKSPVHRTATTLHIENWPSPVYTGCRTNYSHLKKRQEPEILRIKRFTTALIFACAVALSTLLACNSANEGQSVTGIVVDVQVRSISEFESLSLEDENGRTWMFKGGAFAGFTPSHLQEHGALKEPVKVWYTEQDGVLTVTRIEDG